MGPARSGQALHGLNWTGLLAARLLTTCQPLKRSDVAKCFDEANGCQFSQLTTYRAVYPALTYIHTYWLLPMDIGMCVCTLFQYFHFYHKTICWCATFKAFPIFLCSFAFIRCTFCNKVASRSFIVATAAAAPQRPKHSISLYIFYCLKQRMEKRKEEGEREKKTHCRTL